MKPLDPKAIPDLLADAISWWGLQNVAKALEVTDRSVRRWRNGEGLDKILPRNHERLSSLLQAYTEGGDSPPPLMMLSRAARQGNRLALAKAAAAEAKTGADATDAVRDFYEAINQHELKRAWSCLTRAFQERRWKRGYPEFAAGYATFTGLDSLVTTTLRPISSDVCRVLVYYEELVEILDLPELARWRAATLGELAESAADLDAVRIRLRAASTQPAEIDKLLLSRLSTEHAANVLLMASRLSEADFSAVLRQASVHHTRLAMPLIAVVRRSVDARFLIDSLSPLHWGGKAPAR